MSNNFGSQFSTTTNPFSLGNGKDDASMFGGSVPLPKVDHKSSHPHSKMVSFVFTYEEDILNSSVLGPKGQQYFAIGTDVGKHLLILTTIIQSANGTHARIEWGQPHSTVEWNGVLEKQTTGALLRLTPDRKQRFMTFKQTQFVWSPSNAPVLVGLVQFIYTMLALTSFELSTASSYGSEVVARVDTIHVKSTIVDVSAEGIAQGFLEIVILAVVLLMSGRPID
ncbi:hypothetical protein DL96DRAFT_1779026 [Flagelloscypha sp. PMI_526]|nr:hypothetical protein DL96DRAFT_1779026 [Flagelloscypha sp. PMI_526]